MNKLFSSAAVGLALGAVSAVSAIDMSAGGGLFLAGDLGGGFAGIKYNNTSYSIPWLGVGANAFFDAVYGEIGLGLAFAGGTPQQSREGGFVEKVEGADASAVILSVGVLGKYPIALNDAMTLSPAAGVEYALALSGTVADYVKSFYGNDASAGDFSALWFKFGAELDYVLTDKMSLRPAVLYGIRLSNKYESDYIKERSGLNSESALGHGITVRVGVGYKL